MALRQGRGAPRPYEIDGVADLLQWGPMRIALATSEDMDGLFRLRHEVYSLEQGLDAEDADEWDLVATHVVARDENGGCIGTARLFEQDGQWYIGRMVVAQPHRGSGIGRLLVQALEAIGRQRDVSSIHLHAQLQAAGFYAKLGYQPFGEVHLTAGVPHQWMEKSMTRWPPDQEDGGAGETR